MLSAAHVANEGVIQANLGKVVLGGANAFTVDLNGDNLIRYQVTSEVTRAPVDSKGDVQKALVSNSGKIIADGGTVLMTSRAASNVQDNVINNSGIVEATSVSAHDGEVVLSAGPNGTVEDSGTVNVSGTQAGETGGVVTMTGRNITVADGAHIDAEGYDGGGTVRIGGNFHGQGNLHQARNVTIGKAAINVECHAQGQWRQGGAVVQARHILLRHHHRNRRRAWRQRRLCRNVRTQSGRERHGCCFDSSDQGQHRRNVVARSFDCDYRKR